MTILTTYTSAADFLIAARAYLEAHEVANGLMLGLAIRLVDEPLAYGSSPYLAVVTEGRNPVLAALMTPPHNLIVSSALAHAPDALAALAQDLAAGGWPVTGVAGAAGLSAPFAEIWAQRAGVTARPGMSQRLYELRSVIAPRWSPGELRVATAEEADLVIGWLDDFYLEAVPGDVPPRPEMTCLRIADREILLWDDGGPVSMAIKTRPTAHGISIGAVYTPPGLRRRGYATSCVAALSAQLLAEGYEYCSLFTDLSNLTSNDIYQQIGYRPVCDLQEFKFDPG